MLNLKDKKILVMGATGGIGRETAILLSKLGAKLVISGRSTDRLEEVFNLLEGIGHNKIAFDIKDIDKISTFIKDIVEFDNIKLDGLVYSTGIIPTMPIKNTNYEFLHNVMLVNYFGFAEMVRNFSNKKFSNGGSIVALSSYASINGDKGQLAYSASKGAIDSSIVVMAKELFTKNIRVNAIRPAIVNCEELNLNDRTEQLVNLMQTGPINPKNIAEQVAFLLSDCSSGVYGRCFDIRGYLS
ncbi:SDR family oxidoreductase [Aliarcobacter butzleri]|uniref:SDR family NAD(P)-dependent oxidoreductase n=1 Tax=Aliarcobacter butzleri TaxID=28197 RepID=UPI0021B15C5F|nr:SDR family oxidoreductase [Aliarcobacter butzleri]UXC29336.1 SDR family oxidoreductase [Aliarcobacter butzleri]